LRNKKKGRVAGAEWARKEWWEVQDLDGTPEQTLNVNGRRSN
jgi:hypothetical protein